MILGVPILKHFRVVIIVGVQIFTAQRGSYTSGHFIEIYETSLRRVSQISYKVTTSVRFCLSYDPLKWDFIALKMKNLRRVS